MKKLLSIVSTQKQPIVESVQPIQECGAMPTGPSPIPSIPPVSMNVSMNAQGVDQIKELLNLMNATQSNQLSAPSLLPPAGAPMDMPHSEPMGMPAAGLDIPMSIEPAKKEEPGLDDLNALVKNAGIGGDKPAAKGASSDNADGEKSPLSSAAEEIRSMADKLADKNEQAEEEYANEPDEQVADASASTPSGDDMHREKNQYAKAQDGDNAMSVESIRSQLDARYKELKEAKKAKPDYLDMDKDGDKKEPMKKALKDKKVDEATKTDKPWTDMSGKKHPGTAVKGDKYTGKEAEKDDKKDEDVEEGFEAGAKPGSTFKTAKGTATKTKTGLVHTRDKYDYDPGSDDKDDKKMKRDAKKK